MPRRKINDLLRSRLTSVILAFLITAAMMPRLSLATESKAAENSGAERVIHFPKDRSLGLVRVGKLRPVDPLWWQAFKAVSPARGDVTIPAGHDVYLFVTEEGAGNLSALDGLKPDDIQALGISSADKTTDPISHLATWTGLKLLMLNPSISKAGSPSISKAGYAGISQLKSLEGLWLGGMEFTDDDLEYLAPLKSLRVLDLSRTPVTDKGLRHLQDLASLESLTLGFGNINGSGFAALKGLKSLRTLWLNGSLINNGGLEHVAELESLEILSLFKTSINDKGLAHLSHLKSLRELNLNDTKVTDEGLNEIAKLTALEHLGLPRNTTDAGLTRLKSLTGLKHLDLGNTRLTGAGLEVLKGFRSLEYLQLPQGVTDKDLAAIQELGSLEELWIQNSPITNEGMGRLAGLKSLKTLLIHGLKITGAGLAHLKELPSLKSLTITRLFLDETRFTHIAGLTSLEKLDIRDTPLCDEDLAHVGKLKKVMTLSLSDSSAIGDEGMARLSDMTSLENLQMGAARLTDESLHHVAKLENLRSLSLSGDFSEEGLHALERLKSLQDLHLTSTNDLASVKTEEFRKRMPLLVTVQIRRDKSAYRDLDIGEAAPRFAVKTLDGRKIKSEDYRGKVVLLYFWATWCSPCVASTPGLKELYDELSQHKDFAMISLSLDTTEAPPRRHAERYKLTWPQVYLGGDSPIAAAYGVRNSAPVYILVGPDGKILLSREHNWGKIKEAVEKALKTLPVSNPAGK